MYYSIKPEGNHVCLGAAWWPIGYGLQRVAFRCARFWLHTLQLRPTSTKRIRVIRFTNIRFVPIGFHCSTTSMSAFRSGNILDPFYHGHHESQPYILAEYRSVVRQ